MGAADYSEAGEEHGDAMSHFAEERIVDRSHNRDTLSSEAMTEMLRDLQDALLALDERLVVIESSQDSASEDTRRLAKGVADMGDVLARRVRALEQGSPAPPPILAPPAMPPPAKPVRQPPQNRAAWTIGLIFVLALVLAAFWLLGAESLDRANITASPKPAVAAPPAAPKVAPVAPPPAQTPPKRPFHTFTGTHRSTYQRNSSTHTPAATNSTTATPVTGFGHYGPSPSVATPTPPPAATSTPSPSHPPS